MPGVKGRSGRRTLASVPDGFTLPELGDTEESVREHTRALSKAVSSGQIDPRMGDALRDIAAVHLRTIRDEKDRGKNERIVKLERIVAEIERAGIATEVSDRQHLQGDEAN